MEAKPLSPDIREASISAKVTFHKIQFENGECHTIVEMPTELEGDTHKMLHKPDETFNILMADVSQSMSSWWPLVYKHWNEKIAPKLIGTTKIFTFGDEVRFHREESTLQNSDFDAGMTNLTEGIHTIRNEVEKCKQNIIRVFLITDGFHNASRIAPDKAIRILKVPHGKMIEVFLIGVGTNFPVEYSINIRSRLHNGNSNLPSIFWAKEYGDYENEMMSIADILGQGSVKLEFSPPGSSVPGLEKSLYGYQGEYFYYPISPEDMEEEFNLSMVGHGSLLTEFITQTPTLQFFLDKVFRQWNSIIIQQHRNKREIPHEAFDVMEKIYKYLIKEEEIQFELINPGNTIKTRLQRKYLKSMEVDYSTLMNQSKMIIGLEGKYETELELAENILKSTVKSKYDTKNLKMKGHSSDDYTKDIKEFMSIWKNQKANIVGLKEPNDDDCCSVTFASTIKDLQDSSLEILTQEDKFTFMRTFNVTGIPIYAPINDSSQINPWTIRIKNILVSPYKIVSQTTLEMSIDAGLTAGVEDKEIYLQQGDESSRFNAIVPVYSSDVVAVLKPLLITNAFQMVITFCILKNPHIIDHNAHIAGLACIWAKTIDDNPIENRADFAKSRLKMIEATASIYLDRKGIATYIDILLSKSNQALMTESKDTFGRSTLKCEALTKPVFFLYLNKNDEKVKQLRKKIFVLIAAEYIGRCIAGKHSETQKPCRSNRNNANIIQTTSSDDACAVLPYSEYFAYSSKSSSDCDKNSMESKLDDFMEKFDTSGAELINQYFTLQDLFEAMKQKCRDDIDSNLGSLFEIMLNVEKVKRLHNSSATGQLSWTLLRKLAEELGLSETELNEVFKIEQVFIYVCHALQHKGSRDRLETEMPTYDEAFKIVKKKVDDENLITFRKRFVKKMLLESEKRWRTAYDSVHSSLATPMSKKEMIERAQKKGIEVDEETFLTVYKYNPVSGLTRNCCLVESCPQYLMPSRHFNQHISIERQMKDFPHSLHQTSLLVSKDKGGSSEVMDILLNSKEVRPKTAKRQKKDKKTSIEVLKPLASQIDSLVTLYKNLDREVGID